LGVEKSRERIDGILALIMRLGTSDYAGALHWVVLH
jgi:hypothetical protein